MNSSFMTGSGRFKGRGMSWSHAGAQNLLKLRILTYDDTDRKAYWRRMSPCGGLRSAYVVALRKTYGKDLILAGNIDKRVFAKGKDAIGEEVMSKVPFLLETGGYFPCLDHLIPPDISLENFRYFINLLREIGVIPYVFLILITLGLCIAFPQIILWLPGMMIK